MPVTWRATVPTASVVSPGARHNSVVLPVARSTTTTPTSCKNSEVATRRTPLVKSATTKVARMETSRLRADLGSRRRLGLPRRGVRVGKVRILLRGKADEVAAVKVAMEVVRTVARLRVVLLRGSRTVRLVAQPHGNSSSRWEVKVATVMAVLGRATAAISKLLRLLHLATMARRPRLHHLLPATTTAYRHPRRHRNRNSRRRNLLQRRHIFGRDTRHNSDR